MRKTILILMLVTAICTITVIFGLDLTNAVGQWGYLFQVILLKELK